MNLRYEHGSTLSRRARRVVFGASFAAFALSVVACGSGDSGAPATAAAPNSSAAVSSSGPATGSSTTTVPGTIADGQPINVYDHAGAGQMSPAVAGAKKYVYVPSNDDGSVTVIDQETKTIVDKFQAGALLQHVVPGWDLKTLYATASGSNVLVPIDPTTGKRGKSIPVDAPYNLYFSPDGSMAIVMAERRHRIDFYDTSTWKRVRSIKVGACDGVNHADYSVDETWFLVTCEFSGDILKVDWRNGTIINSLALPKGAMPQDIRIVPDGSKFYVADMQHACVWIVDATGTKVIGKIDTGTGTHGIYPSRDAKLIYVTNRGRLMNDTHRKSRKGEGSISVVDPTTDKVVGTWPIPGGGSPDMGGVSADGTELWISGRYDAEVYVFDTTTGAVKAQIKVGPGPHGLAVFPQPGRYSLGHTGVYR
ncbi:MAG: hypothetical protein WCO88_10700 [Actinomycetota bacterium]